MTDKQLQALMPYALRYWGKADITMQEFASYVALVNIDLLKMPGSKAWHK